MNVPGPSDVSSSFCSWNRYGVCWWWVFAYNFWLVLLLVLMVVWDVALGGSHNDCVVCVCGEGRHGNQSESVRVKRLGEKLRVGLRVRLGVRLRVRLRVSLRIRWRVRFRVRRAGAL